MSIEKARIYLKAKLKKTGKQLVAQTQSKEFILNYEDFSLLSYVNNKNFWEVSRLRKKNINGLLKKILDFEEWGLVNFELPCEDAVLQSIYQKRDSRERVCKRRPAVSNIIAYEKEWNVYPAALDFLDKKSENYKLKNLEKEVYFDLIRPFLSEIPKGSIIIDAGGGIGRFALELLQLGYKVHLVDASEIALKKALRHLQDKNMNSFDLYWGDVANLSMFSDNSFDAAFAIELICYCDKPSKVISELVRVTKKNGLIVISVEGKYGGLLSDPNVSFDKLATIFQDDSLYIKNHLFVHYYTPKILERLLKKSGIEIIDMFGCHYVLDGIFHRLINIDRLGNREYRKNLYDIERFCQNDPVLKNLARAWLVVGRKK
jgi:ubiquinone/menaquinone biosynthesis C-methylase UbiE